jgi:hypothetical protein
MLRIITLVLIATGTALLAQQPTLRSVKNWEVRGAPGKITWVELHDIDPADPSVIHVELLARKRTDKPWEIEHLQPHVAITFDALQRSVVRPRRTNTGVYPESFNFGYKHWREEADAAKRVVCSTTLYECAETGAR